MSDVLKTNFEKKLEYVLMGILILIIVILGILSLIKSKLVGG